MVRSLKDGAKRKQAPEQLKIIYLSVKSLVEDPKNARKHSAQQIAKLARIIAKMGWSSPIVIDENNMIIAGHARLLAALSLGMAEVPCVRLSHLDAASKKALAIADNAMSDASGWDSSILRETLIELTGLDFNLELTGLEIGIIDFVIDGSPNETPMDRADLVEAPRRKLPAITQFGDLWLLDGHKLLCGDALELVSYERLLGPERATMIFSDPPFNIPVAQISGLGRHRHPEFAMATGEMTLDQFCSFLIQVMGHLVSFSCDGSIHYLCIDWRQVRTMLEAGEKAYAELKNIVVWNKSNGGMSSLYRSKHELIVVFEHGRAPHINNVALGKHGRNRTNVWDYPGANAFGATRDSDLASHPTTKPLALVADAMRDCRTAVTSSSIRSWARAQPSWLPSAAAVERRA